jgi:aarF domain-containing kinase
MSSSPYIFLRTAARRQSQRATPPFFKPWRLSSYGGRYSFQSRFLSTAAPALTSSVFQSAFLWNSIFPTPPEPKAVQHRHAYPDTTTILACSNAAVAHKKSLFRVLKELLRKCWNLVLVTVRGTEIALILSPMALFVPASVLSAQLLHTSIVSDISWAYLLKSVQVLGPAFCKLCQWIATRRDVFPPNICDRLGKLHDHGTPHSWKHTERTLKEAFGDYEAKGLTIQEVVGCGSAAQVYRGMLTTSDEDGNPTTKLVAIKVLHPHFKRLVENDMWFLQSGADLLHSLPFERIRMLNLPRAASNFGTVLRKQADLTIEGENLNRFRRNFYHTKKQENDSAILFPQAIEGWMSTKVLVEDLVYDAVPIAAYIKDGSDEVRKELAAPLLQAFLKMVFIDNWVHCDIHP